MIRLSYIRHIQNIQANEDQNIDKHQSEVSSPMVFAKEKAIVFECVVAVFYSNRKV